MSSDMPQPLAQFTVFGTVDDFTGRLTVASVLPGAHADQVVELLEDEPDVSRYAYVFAAPDANHAAAQARAAVDDQEDDADGQEEDVERCPDHGADCEADDHMEPPTVYGEVI
jgi:hypothetical protein